MAEAILIIIAVNLALYLKTLRYKFVSDDFTVWKNPPVFKNPWHKAWLRFIGACKLQSKSFHFIRHNRKNFLAIAKSEEMEHLIALLIHIAICVVMYFAFGANHVGLIASLLYSTNPINNQGTIWPGGRGYALPILTILIVLAWPIVSPLALFFCSSFTIGFLYPLALIGSNVPWWVFAFMAVGIAWHGRQFVKAVKNKHKTETFDEDRKMTPKKLILAVKSLGFYFFLCLFPFRITFYHNFLQSAAGSMAWKCYTFCRYFWIGFALIVGFITYSVMVPWSTLHWAILAFMIAIGPFCNLIRANQECAERFAAPANVFLMYALAQVIAPYPIVCVAFIVYYATRTFHTLIMYKDEYYITELAVIEDPHAWWAWHCRAMKRWDTQAYKEALLLWSMARLISPNEFKILMNIATALRVLGNPDAADKHLELAGKCIVPGQEKQAKQFIEQHKSGKLPILL